MERELASEFKEAMKGKEIAWEDSTVQKIYTFLHFYYVCDLNWDDTFQKVQSKDGAELARFLGGLWDFLKEYDE